MAPIKIGFVLVSNSQRPIPSTRISVLNMFPFLRAANFHPEIVFEPYEVTEKPAVSRLMSRLIAQNFKFIFFQKVHGPDVEQLARQLSAAGLRTVYGVCDQVNASMAEATDATVATSEYLKSMYPPALQSKITVVHDGIERPEIFKTQWNLHRGSAYRPLHAVLVTSFHLDSLPVLCNPPGWLNVSIVGRYPRSDQLFQHFREAGWSLSQRRTWNERFAYLRFLTNPRIRCLAWDARGVYETMRHADIGIIPIDTQPAHKPPLPPPHWKIKSANRLTMKMCVGLPVVATPIPSYERVIEQGRNGFLAQSHEEWIAHLTRLRDPDYRRAIGSQARESVLEGYSKEKQAALLIKVLQDLGLD